MSFGAANPGVGVGGASAGDVLPFTGTGPGTLPLAIIGFAALVVGAFATLFGRKRHLEAGVPRNGLADLSPLAASAGPGASRHRSS
jgi:hypothetical protein